MTPEVAGILVFLFVAVGIPLTCLLLMFWAIGIFDKETWK